MKKTKPVHFKFIFLSAVATLAATILIVYFSGLKDHRTLYANALIIITIMASATLIFTTIGLYNGWRLIGWRDPLKEYMAAVSKKKMPNIASLDGMPTDDGDAGCLGTIIILLVVTGIGLVLIWLAGLFFIGLLVALWSVLYWLVWNTVNLFFRHSARCHGNMYKSISTAFLYTCIYFSWLYAIILLGHWIGSNGSV